jgi:hypothetical protein
VFRIKPYIIRLDLGFIALTVAAVPAGDRAPKQLESRSPFLCGSDGEEGILANT